jgi:hypothetical protein
MYMPRAPGISSFFMNWWLVCLVVPAFILFLDSQGPGLGYQALPWLQCWGVSRAACGWGPTGIVVRDGSGVRVLGTWHNEMMQLREEGIPTLAHVWLRRAHESLGVFTDCVDFEQVDVQVGWRDRGAPPPADLDTVRRGFAEVLEQYATEHNNLYGDWRGVAAEVRRPAREWVRTINPMACAHDLVMVVMLAGGAWGCWASWRRSRVGGVGRGTRLEVG